MLLPLAATPKGSPTSSKVSLGPRRGTWDAGFFDRGGAWANELKDFGNLSPTEKLGEDDETPQFDGGEKGPTN